jgi:uncharacterized protein YjbI with pentapeptide repeats
MKGIFMNLKALSMLLIASGMLLASPSFAQTKEKMSAEKPEENIQAIYNPADYMRALSGDKNLCGANLQGADLERKNLQGVDLSKANLKSTELEDANLQGANLCGANLQNADLEGANLTGAKVNEANFDGADLENAIWIDGKPYKK